MLVTLQLNVKIFTPENIRKLSAWPSQTGTLAPFSKGMCILLLVNNHKIL